MGDSLSFESLVNSHHVSRFYEMTTALAPVLGQFGTFSVKKASKNGVNDCHMLPPLEILYVGHLGVFWVLSQPLKHFFTN